MQVLFGVEKPKWFKICVLGVKKKKHKIVTFYILALNDINIFQIVN